MVLEMDWEGQIYLSTPEAPWSSAVSPEGWVSLSLKLEESVKAEN